MNPYQVEQATAPPTNGDTVRQVVDAANANFQAAQAAAYEAPGARALRFAVPLGILAWGVVKQNVYLEIVGGGFLLYFLFLDRPPAPPPSERPANFTIPTGGFLG